MKKISLEKARNIIALLLWLFVIVFFLINRDTITLEKIVNYTHENVFLAIAVILFLFFLKSLVFFIYLGFLCAASGVIFPLPLALIVNFVGLIIMSSVPYFIGKKAGSKALDLLSEKNPKIQIIREMQKKNEFFVSFFARILGLLPVDVVSLYMGASLVKYKAYITGSVIGFLPSMISFTVMGIKADDPTSPAFVICVIFEFSLMLVSILFLHFYRRMKNKK